MVNRFFMVIFCFIIINHGVQALVLEDLVKSGKLEQTLSNKKVGYYLGSFDPLHKGHEAIIEESLKDNLCDFIIVYAIQGYGFDEIRTDIKIRNDMLIASFKDHPNVIVTRVSPVELQKYLTKPDNLKNKGYIRTVEPRFPGVKFISIIESDLALKLDCNKNALRKFMSGILITKEYTPELEELMVFRVMDFIIILKKTDNESHFIDSIDLKKSNFILKYKDGFSISSAMIKELLNNEKNIDHLVNKSVMEIIKSNEIYKKSFILSSQSESIK